MKKIINKIKLLFGNKENYNFESNIVNKVNQNKELKSNYDKEILEKQNKIKRLKETA